MDQRLGYSRRSTTEHRAQIVLFALCLTPLLSRPATAQTLGESMLYTAIQPCRIIDTRIAGGALVANQSRGFAAVGTTSYASQGGDAGGCPIPGIAPPGGVGLDAAISHPVQAILVNLVAVGPAGAGDLQAWPSDQSRPTASALNFDNTARGLNIANAVILPVQQANSSGPDILLESQVSGTHVVADVYGYFSTGSATGANTNTFLGAGILQGSLGLADGAMWNAGFGVGALFSLSTGVRNTALGTETMEDATSASTNVAVGNSALRSLKTGSFNIAVGTGAGAAYGGTEADNIDIGSEGVSGESGAIHIGDTQLATFIAGIQGKTSSSGTEVFINTSGQLGTTTSSLRFKDDIANMGASSDELMKLRPVTFHYKPGIDDGSNVLQYGLVAEEVAKVYPGLVQYDESGQPVAVRYHFINALLLNEVQRQHRQIESDHSRMAELEKSAAAQQARMEKLEAAILDVQSHERKATSDTPQP